MNLPAKALKVRPVVPIGRLREGAAMLNWVMALTFTLTVSAAVHLSMADRSIIRDNAGLLSDDTKRHIEEVAITELAPHRVFFRTIIVNAGGEDLDLTTDQLFGMAKVGWGKYAPRGFLLVVDPSRKKARLRRGYEIEYQLPDPLLDQWESEVGRDFLAAGNFSAGILAVTDLLSKALKSPESMSSLAVVTSPVQIGKDVLQHRRTLPSRFNEQRIFRLDHKVKDPSTFVPSAEPVTTLETYKAVLADHVKDPELPLFTKDTQEFFNSWTRTHAEQDAELSQLNQATAAETKVKGNLAAVKLKDSNGNVVPYFFRKEDGRWKIDLAIQAKIIDRISDASWKFRTRDHEYMFAFENSDPSDGPTPVAH